MSEQPFVYLHRVTYADCTAGNHIYYGRYLNLLEAARGEFIRSLGSSFLAWQERDAIFPVIECRLRYKAQARYDDLLAITVIVSQMEGIRVAFQYRITNEQQSLILQCETLHVCTTLAGKPRRVPPELLELLRRGGAAAPSCGH